MTFADAWASIGKVHAWQAWPQQALGEVCTELKRLYRVVAAARAVYEHDDAFTDTTPEKLARDQELGTALEALK